jgi:hypothetical protein
MISEQELEKLRYPIGKWEKPLEFDFEKITEQIVVIGNFPEKIKSATTELSDEQLDTPYRPEGWTVRQVVHHCADSHMNAFIRFKLALTENRPTIKPYAENLWAELQDGKSLSVKISLQLIEALHVRWGVLLTSLNDEQWKRGFIHPEHGGELKLYETVSLYAWHCEHHLAHIMRLKERMSWN